MRISRLLSATALAGTLLCSPAVAWAQEESTQDTTVLPDTEEDEPQEAGSTIVVTGSRIARPTLESAVPLTSVEVSELTNQGNVSLGDALNDLPSLRSTYSLGNSTRFIGTAGLSLLDLRGLGISRTLVLVNGRRHVTAVPGENLVDANTIPVDLLERVDVVTGGNSAIYGSDAVAGVVNFILKRDFDGLSVRGQGGISERSDRGAYFASLTAGMNFAEGRGNIAVSTEIAYSSPLYFKDRDFQTGAYSGRCQFMTAEVTSGEPGGTDGIPDNQFICGVRNAGISNGGSLGTVTLDGVAGLGALRFAPNGELFLERAQRSFAPFGAAFQQGGTGATLRDTGLLAAGLQRWTGNLLARFDVSDAFKPFVEAKYVRINSTQEGQPHFMQGGLNAFFGGGQNLRCDNPFLSANSIALMRTYGLCGGTAAYNPAATFSLARFNVDFGGRGEFHTRDTWRVVGGIEGDFNDDWHYELAVNYGRLDTNYRALNNLYLFDAAGNDDGFLLASNPRLAPAGFTGSNFVTNAAGQRVVCAVNSTIAGNVRPDCVPINLFGEGQPDPRAIAFSHRDGFRNEWAEQFTVSAFLRGDLSQLFELPGGPIQFALGGEYRKEDSFARYDPLTENGQTFLNAIQPFDPPTLEVKEAYGEVRIPLLRDLPGFHILTIEGAGRVSEYNNTTGTVYAWNLSGIWAPISDVRFRANYSTSVRAPTQGDLYSTASQNFAQLADPCDVINISNNPNRAANCAAFGVPATANAQTVAECAGTGFPLALGDPFINCIGRTQTTGFLSGGNPTLVAEEGKSLTIGAIFSPRFIPGLSLTVDYYQIDLENRIAVLGAQTILNLCFDNPSGINNAYCQATFARRASGLFDDPALIAGGVNFATQETRGIDFDLAYNHRFANGHRLNVRAIATHVLRLNNYVDPVNPDFADRQLSELGDPEWAANGSISYDFGTFSLGYSVQYIGKQTIGAYEAQHGFQGRAPTNADQYPFKYYPEVFYHNLRFGVDVDDYTFYLGVDNVTDELPPYGLLGTGAGDPFDVVGRYFYAGVNVNF